MINVLKKLDETPYIWPLFGGLMGIIVSLFIRYAFDIGIALVCLMLYLLCFYYISRSKAHVGALTSAHIFFFLYTVYIFMPALLGFIIGPDGLQAKVPLLGNYRVLFSAMLGILFFTVGTIWVDSVFGISLSERLKRFRNTQLKDNLKIPFWLIAIPVIAYSTTITVWFFVTNIDMVVGIFSQAAFVASENRLALRSGQGHLTINFVYVLPAMSLLLILKSIASEKLWIKASAAVVALLCLFSLAMFSFRGNIIFYILMVAMLIQSISFRSSIRSRVLVVILLSIALVMITALRTEISTDQSLLMLTIEKLVNRAFTSVVHLGYILDTFPRIDMFPGETYLIDLLALKPGPDIGFNGMIYEEMGYWGDGTATITIIGEFYANFGYVGIIVGMFLIGSLLRILHVWLICSNKKITDLFIYVIASIYLSKTVIAGIGENLFPALLVHIPLLAVILVSTAVFGPTHNKSGSTNINI